jgi:hypothetical protein
MGEGLDCNVLVGILTIRLIYTKIIKINIIICMCIEFRQRRLYQFGVREISEFSDPLATQYVAHSNYLHINLKQFKSNYLFKMF